MRRSRVAGLVLVFGLQSMLAFGVASTGADERADSVTPQSDQTNGLVAPTTPADLLAMTIAVSAPDGPTLETRADVQRATEKGFQSIILKLENGGLIQDEDLMELIRGELYDILAESGYSQSDITLIECPEFCDADASNGTAGPP